MFVNLFFKAIEIAGHPNRNLPIRVQRGLFSGRLVHEISRIRHRKTGQFAHSLPKNGYGFTRVNFFAVSAVLTIGAIVLSATKRYGTSKTAKK
jgi:hypothetical protein